MADFPPLEGFEDSATPVTPGDFLARERQVLGDTFGGEPVGHVGHSYGGDGVSDGYDMVDGSSYSGVAATSSRPPPASAAVNDEALAFDNKYPDLGVPQTTQNGYSAPAQSLYSQPATSFAAPSVYAQTEMEEESEHIKAWREKQAEEIRKRDERSATKRDEMITAGEQAIDDFYNAYNNEKEKNIARNKKQEADFLRARDDALAQGTTWQRIADLIELQDSRSKTISKATRDVSRFKEILLSLKRDGESAPGAAGY